VWDCQGHLANLLGLRLAVLPGVCELKQSWKSVALPFALMNVPH